jgi:hypothetical protein
MYTGHIPAKNQTWTLIPGPSYESSFKNSNTSTSTIYYNNVIYKVLGASLIFK